MSKKDVIFAVFLILLALDAFAYDTPSKSNDFYLINSIADIYKTGELTGVSLVSNYSETQISNCALSASPLVYDLNNDSILDIIVYCSNVKKLKAYNINGSLIAEYQQLNATQGSIAINPNDPENVTVVQILNNGTNNSIYSYALSGTTFIESYVKLIDNIDVNVICWYNYTSIGWQCDGVPVNTAMIDVEYTSLNPEFCRVYDGSKTSTQILCSRDSDFSDSVTTYNYEAAHAPARDCKEARIMAIDIDSPYFLAYSTQEILFQCQRDDFKSDMMILDSSGAELIFDEIVSDVEVPFGSGAFSDLSHPCHYIETSARTLIKCYESNGDTWFSLDDPEKKFIREGFGINQDAYYVLSADFNNDGKKDIVSNEGVYDFWNDQTLINFTDLGGGSQIAVIDLDLDGSLDYIRTDDSNNIYISIGDYTADNPEITTLETDTQSPICLNSIVTYTATVVADSDSSYFRLRVDCYNNGTWSDYSVYSTMPDISCFYDTLGNVDTSIEISDLSNQKSTFNFSVVVVPIDSSCHASGESVGDINGEEIETNTSVHCVFGWCTHYNPSGNYVRDEQIYSPTSNTYFDESRCEEVMGPNWRTGFIPCYFRVMWYDSVEWLKDFIFKSLTTLLVVLIGFGIFVLVKEAMK